MNKNELEKYIVRMEEIESRSIYPAYAQAWTEFKSVLLEEYEQLEEQPQVKEPVRMQEVTPQPQQPQQHERPPLRKAYPEQTLRRNIQKIETNDLYDDELP